MQNLLELGSNMRILSFADCLSFLMDIRSFFAPKGGAKPPDAKKNDDNKEVCQYVMVGLHKTLG